MTPTVVTKAPEVAAPGVITNRPEEKRHFIGRAWINTANTKKGPMKFINLVLDNKTESVTLTKAVKLQLWPNNKREGKDTDADYSVSVMVPVA